MLSSDYLANAQKLTKLASPHINFSMSPENAIQGALLFALGVEKLLKHVLVEINPILATDTGCSTKHPKLSSIWKWETEALRTRRYTPMTISKPCCWMANGLFSSRTARCIDPFKHQFTNANRNVCF